MESKLEILKASNYGVVGEGHCRKARVACTDGWFDKYAAMWRSLWSAHLETMELLHGRIGQTSLLQHKHMTTVMTHFAEFNHSRNVI